MVTTWEMYPPTSDTDSATAQRRESTSGGKGKGEFSKFKGTPKGQAMKLSFLDEVGVEEKFLFLAL